MSRTMSRAPFGRCERRERPPNGPREPRPPHRWFKTGREAFALIRLLNTWDLFQSSVFQPLVRRLLCLPFARLATPAQDLNSSASQYLCKH